MPTPNETGSSGTKSTGRKSLKDSHQQQMQRDLNLANDRIRLLETEIRGYQRESLTADHVKRIIVGLHDGATVTEPPTWLSTERNAGSLGVPTLLASDWHWGEVVDPNQIGGVNEYNLDLARRRARTMIDRACHLCFSHLSDPKYPGIVFALGGDMLSGDIHEELTATNEREIMPVVLDLYGVLKWCITTLKMRFGRVFIPCVSGNHGRNTHKIRAKGRNFTSFDWLVYCFLAEHFQDDPSITFLIPDGPDCYYRVGSHRFLLSHGDQFRGGDGLIGPLGPVTRGDAKKRSRNSQIAMEYDLLMIGHFHMLLQTKRICINGSLKGYDEYAFSQNYPYEPPMQALFLTHPERGITFSFPVQVENPKKLDSKLPWVSWR